MNIMIVDGKVNFDTSQSTKVGIKYMNYTKAKSGYHDARLNSSTTFDFMIIQSKYSEALANNPQDKVYDFSAFVQDQLQFKMKSRSNSLQT